MSILNNSIKRVVLQEYQEEDSDILDNICRSTSDCDADGGVAGASSTNMEAEKRIRREIANSNERRRMQSINAGFQSLRTLLPHHEGEKLSKAAILQQTAEYIYNLEQEKTRLLSQNSQLMRQVHQHEGGEVPPKKRKAEVLLHPVSESSDEGLGSMSPEPVAIVGMVNSPIVNTNLSKEIAELRRQLEREHNVRAHLEEQVRNMEGQLYQQMQYAPQEVIEAGEEMRDAIVTVIQEPEEQLVDMQLLVAENVPPVGQTQTVMCSPQLSRSPSPSPCTVVTLRAASPAPPDASPRLPSALEAAIKAEPKVEVERLPSPVNAHDDVNCSRIYVANTSRQNLETIVEAIRHLEGDHLFSDEPSVKQEELPQQDVPLALTTKTPQPHALKVEMNPYLQFHGAKATAAATVAPAVTTATTSTLQQQLQQQRPGVIVVKQHS